MRSNDSFFPLSLPENPCHRPDALADDPELSVWGVATSVVHCLRR